MHCSIGFHPTSSGVENQPRSASDPVVVLAAQPQSASVVASSAASAAAPAVASTPSQWYDVPLH